MVLLAASVLRLQTTLLVVGVEVALGCGVVYWSPDVDGRGEEKDLPARIEVEPPETDGVA